MSKISIDEKNVEAAYKVADEAGKKLLDALFGKNGDNKPTPTLDYYKTIKSYEDACKALGIEPTLNRVSDRIYDESHNILGVIPKHIIALMKLETISRALWGKNWEPKPDATGSNWFYYPWFALWTKEKIKVLNGGQRGALLSALAVDGADAGFGFLTTFYRSSYATASFGFRLCQETEEKAEYFGQQFVELWAEYLAFNFTVGERFLTW